jgi:cytochrome P450
MPKFTGFPRVDIRGPRSLPVVGTFANILRFYGDPVGRMLALHREYGDVAAVSDGDPGLVCAFGAERNREVITNAQVYQHDNEFPFKPPPGSALEQTSISLVFMNGDMHRRQRRLMQPAFTKATIEGYAGDITSIADAELGTWPVGLTADLAVLLRRLTVSVVLRCLYGLDPGARADELGRVMTRMIDVVTSPAVIALPYRIPGTPFNELFDLTERFVAELLRLVDEKRRQPAGQRDVLALMVRAHDEDGSTFTDTELVGQMNMLFAAGYDTSAQTLAWTLLLLAHHPEILGDLLDEIDGVLRGGAPTVEHLPRLVLLDRVIKESMRILPATPMLFIRVCANEAPLGRYVLPKGANVILSPLVTHRDPDRYPEPARFRPARWEGLEPTHYEYLPFGTGPRMCLGAGFATLALRLMLPMILQRYRLSLAYGANISCKVGGIVLGPKPGLPMLIAPQDRAFRRPSPVRGNLREVVDLPS